MPKISTKFGHYFDLTPPHSPYQNIPKEESRRKREEEVRESMRRWWRREEVQESPGIRVTRSQGPRYLKVIFKYELDFKEGPSCCTTLK